MTAAARESQAIVGRYRSLADFYSADARRVSSRELDVGLWWREHGEGPLHRAAWVNDTGELYLVRLGRVEQGGGRVELLAILEDREQLDDALDGWRQQCGRPGSLDWLRARAAPLGSRVRVAHTRMAAVVGAAGTMLFAADTLASESA